MFVYKRCFSFHLSSHAPYFNKHVAIKLNKQIWISLVSSQNSPGIRVLIFAGSTPQIKFLKQLSPRGAINKFNRNQFDVKQTFSRQRKWFISLRLNKLEYNLENFLKG